MRSYTRQVDGWPVRFVDFGLGAKRRYHAQLDLDEDACIVFNGQVEEHVLTALERRVRMLRTCGEQPPTPRAAMPLPPTIPASAAPSAPGKAPARGGA